MGTEDIVTSGPATTDPSKSIPSSKTTQGNDGLIKNPNGGTNCTTNNPRGSKKSRSEKREKRKEKRREERKEKGDNSGGVLVMGPGGLEKLKTVVRRLPPNLPEEIFWDSVKPWVTDDTTAWRAFYQGKIRKKHNKENIPSRAYIFFRRAEYLAAFSQAYDGHIFRDKTGKESIAVVEFSPCQKIPPEKRKVDPRMGTIEQDEDYISFKNSLNNPSTKLSETDTLEALIAASQAPPEPKSTPLLDALRAEKQAQRDKETILKAHAHYRDQGKDDSRRRGKHIVDKDDNAQTPGQGKRRRGAKKAEAAAAKAKASVTAKEKEIIPRIAKPPPKEVTKSVNPPPPPATTAVPTATSGKEAVKDAPKDTVRERRARPVLGLNSRQFAVALNSAGLSVPKKAGRDDEQDKKVGDINSPPTASVPGDKGDKGEGAAKEKSKPNVANSPGKDRNRGGRKRGDSVKSPPNAPMKLPDANSPPVILARPGGAPGILVRSTVNDSGSKPGRRRGGGGRGRGQSMKPEAQDGGA